MLFDTDVVIWVFRGNAAAARAIQAESDRRISVISYMELLQGARGKEESSAIKRFLEDLGFEVLPLTENIGHRASIYIEEYALSSGMCVADALIAATAAENGLRLCTGDKKHYAKVKDLDIKQFRP